MDWELELSFLKSRRMGKVTLLLLPVVHCLRVKETTGLRSWRLWQWYGQYRISGATFTDKMSRSTPITQP